MTYHEITLDLSTVLQNLEDGLQCAKRMDIQFVAPANALEVRLYAAHDRLMARFVEARQHGRSEVIAPDESLTQFNSVREDILDFLKRCCESDDEFVL